MTVPWPSAAAGPVAEAREAAVRLARSGDSSTARARLEALFADHPDDGSLRQDLAVISTWAGDDERALTLLADVSPTTLPDYVLEAQARAARNQQRWSLADAAYRMLGQRHPDALAPRLGLALTLADAGQADAAAAALAEAQRRVDDAQGDDAVAVLLACGYVAGRAGRQTRALDCYQRAADRRPDNAEARQGIVRSAAALGAAHLALYRAKADPGTIDDVELRRLHQDVAAHEIRWSGLAGTRSSAGLALRRLEQPSAASDAGTTAIGQAYDRMAALFASGRHREAIAEFDRVLNVQPQLDSHPAYVLEAVAGAALSTRQPEKAVDLYQAALRQAPDRFSLQAGLFFAYSDLEDHARARAVADHMVASQPPRRTLGDSSLPNPDHVEAHRFAALAMAYRDRYGDALDELDRLLARAPGNSSVRLARADVLRWRGWADAAGRDVARVRHLDPAHLGAAVRAGELAMDQRRYREAEQLLAELSAQPAPMVAIGGLTARLEQHRRRELGVRAGAGRSDGGAFSSRDWHLEAHYFTAPFAHHYRLFVRDRARYGRFDEGIGREHRLGAGVEYRGPHWIARAEVNHGLEQNRKPGAAASAAWLPDDHWRVDLNAAVHGPGTPLRALRLGVGGRELDAGVTYRFDETRAWRAGAGLLDLDDGNLRRSLWTRYEQRLLGLPGQQLTGSISAYAGRNSERDRVYFNPAADLGTSVGLHHDWRVFRRYDRSLSQRLGAEVGRYHQEDFGTGTVWTFSAEHVWSLAPHLSLSYGARTGGRVYDGEREHLATAFVALEKRL